MKKTFGTNGECSAELVFKQPQGYVIEMHYGSVRDDELTIQELERMASDLAELARAGRTAVSARARLHHLPLRKS